MLVSRYRIVDHHYGGLTAIDRTEVSPSSPMFIQAMALQIGKAPKGSICARSVVASVLVFTALHVAEDNANHDMALFGCISRRMLMLGCCGSVGGGLDSRVIFFLRSSNTVK